MMLVLTTHPNETIVIDTGHDSIRIFKKGNKLYIDAPREYIVYREEKCDMNQP